MKHYAKTDGSIWAFEPDGSQDKFITEDMTPVSDADLFTLRTPTFSALKAAEFAKFRTDREQFLNRLAGIGLAAQFDGQADVLASVCAVRVGLLGMTTNATVTAATDLVGLKLAMKTRYAAILSGVPVEVLSAFKQVDA